MFKELLTMLAISPMITNQVTSPYLNINQFVIFNNITELRYKFDNPQTARNEYEFHAEIDRDEYSAWFGQDNKGVYFTIDNSYFYYMTDNNDNIITGNVNQFINWTDYFKPMTLGLDFQDLRNNYVDSLFDDINWYDFNQYLVDEEVAFFYDTNDTYIVQPYNYSSSSDILYKNIFKTYSYCFDVFIGLNNYTYSPYANYNFEFSGYANGSIGDNGPLVSLNGDQNVTYHVSSNTLSQGWLRINLSNISNLDYMSQFVFDTYPFYDNLQMYLGNSYDVDELLSEISSLKAQNERLKRTVEIYESGTSMQNLLWTVAGTPWESFKNIWNVNVLGVNISGLVTGLITALIIVWIVKKIFK